MADIDVVPRRKTPVWWWVVAALIVIAIVWAVAASRTTTRPTSELRPAPHSQVAPIASDLIGVFV